MLAYVHHFLSSLLFSVTVETVSVFLLAIIFKKNKSISLLAGFGTALTIPYVWFVFPTLLWYSSSLSIILAECFAFLVEACIYKLFGKVSWKIALFFSFIANTVSFFLGKLVL
jgi:hypothetical protein